MQRQAHTLKINLPPTSLAPSIARRALWRSFRSRMAVECASDAELLISELVANCVRHAGLPSGEEISLAIYLDEFRLRVEVADNGRGFSELGTTGAEDGGASGWGLLLVQRLADDWGVETDPGVGTTVWFEMPLSPRDV